MPLTRATRIGFLVAILATLGSCGTTIVIADGSWTANCVNVPSDVCEGVANRFVQNLGRRGVAVREASGGHIDIAVASSCPIPEWAVPGTCWRADAPIAGSRACMLIARRVDDGGGLTAFGQVGGDRLSGSVAAPEPGSTPC